MRVLLLTLFAVLVPVVAGAAGRAPLDLPVRYPGIGPDRVPAPAYAGDVVELRLTAAASARAWAARAMFERAAGARSSLAQLGVAGLDRAAAELGGARFVPEFRGETPGRPGEIDFSAFYIARLPQGLALETALDRFAAVPEVAAVSPVAIVPVAAVPNDSLWNASYWFYQASRQDLHAPEAWDITTGDTSVVVGIIDTGVLAWHPDLAGTVAGLSGQLYTNWAEAGGAASVDDDANGYIDDVHGWDFVNLSNGNVLPGEDWQDEDNDPNDYVAHGTGVAGVVGALTDNLIGVAGTAWNVRLMPLRIGWAYANSPVGSGEVRMDFVAAALRYAALMRADIVNCSFETVNELGLAAALDAAAAAGVVVVAAVGNRNQSTAACQTCYMATRYDVISVTSTGSTDVLSSFSNKGPEVDLAAPGENLASTWMFRPFATDPQVPDSIETRLPAYRNTLSGTSLSAPLVAGAAALVQADRRRLGRPPLTPEAMMLRLTETTDDISAQNPTQVGNYGSGRLNLFRALTESWRSDAIRLGARVNGTSAVLAVNDGTRRVALVTQDGHLVVLAGATLDTVALATLPRLPASGVAAADLGGNLGVGLFVGMHAGMAGYAPDGSVLPGWPQLVPPGVQLEGGPAIGDLDGDGIREIVCGDDGGYVHAWHANGSVVTGFPVQVTAFGVVHPVALASLGAARIIAASDDGQITALDAAGAVVPGWPVSVIGDPTSPVEMVIAGTPTVLVVAGGFLHAFQSNGSERSGFPVFMNTAVFGREELALGDVNQDGRNDIVIPCVSPMRLDVRDSTGASLTALNWPRTLASIPLGSPVLGHLTGGGPPELMVMVGSGLQAFSNTADSLASFPRYGNAGPRATLADLDGDGTTEVVAGSGPLQPRLFVYDAGQGSSSSERQPWPTFRGNYARTGSLSDNPAMPVIDVIPPGGVADLQAQMRGGNTVALLWTAPGDDGGNGQLPAYDIRRLLQPIDDTNFHLGIVVPAGSPAAPGAPDSVLVSGLIEGLPNYFALKGRDEGNAGPISNVVSITLPQVSPARVSDLRITATTDSSVALAWTATGDDGTVGRPRVYLVQAALVPIDDANFNSAPYTRLVFATVDAGGTETLQYRFLERGKHYWFALKAFDQSNNSSPLSNVVDGFTKVGGPLGDRAGLALAPGRNPSRVPAALYWQADPAAVGQPVRLRLYDLTGRQVKSFDLGTGAGGVATWDGRDESGNRVAAGLYVARLTSGPRHTQARVVLLP